MNDLLRGKLLSAKTKDEFFRELYYWLREAVSGVYSIDDVFPESQPKYRAYFIECLDEIARDAPFELDRTETKFRKNAEDNYVDFIDVHPDNVWTKDDVCVLPEQTRYGTARRGGVRGRGRK